MQVEQLRVVCYQFFILGRLLRVRCMAVELLHCASDAPVQRGGYCASDGGCRTQREQESAS
jgi:hypothetical protein